MEEQKSVRSAAEILESIDKGIAELKVTRASRKRESDDLRELFKALAQAQPKFKDIQKSGIITGRNIPYAKISDIMDSCRAALWAHNLVLSTFHENEGNGYSSLVTRLYHAPSGQFLDSVLPHLSNVDDQKRGSSITYAWRYTVAPLIGLVDTSCDDDGESTRQVIQPMRR